MATRTRTRQRRRDGFVEVRGANNRLLCRYDPDRGLLEIKRKGSQAEIVDLRKYSQHANDDRAAVDN